MHYTKEWQEAEKLVRSILLAHTHSWESPSWEPSNREVVCAIISFAALGVPGCVTALKAERTAIYEKMRESVAAFMEARGEDPLAIICSRRDKQIADAPYGMNVCAVDGGFEGSLKTFLFQGTPVWTSNKLYDDAQQIVAVNQEGSDALASSRR